MSRYGTPIEATGSLSSSESSVTSVESETKFSLATLQSESQRIFLDTIVSIRKCGLEGDLPLPQLVVCGDQSAGKSSVLEAVTGVPFPRNDGLCTRFATEINLRRAANSTLTIKVIPDKSRPVAEQEQIKKFHESITDFDDLPRVMDLAMNTMGIAKAEDMNASSRAFARDVLSIEIAGPSQPQLTLVDIPGLIATSTRGVTKADVDMVAEITDHYIKQPRTICLAVVCATNDYANQKILEKVRDVDPEGDRTLGIVTKPDGVPEGSASQKNFIGLANNEDIFFKLGWHVLKNRSYEESEFTNEERDAAEVTFFRTHAWNTLPSEHLGVDALRTRLCTLLFEHIKRELPKLYAELESQLETNKNELDHLGAKRSNSYECKSYLSQMSLDFHSICKAAINGQYEGGYFVNHVDSEFSLESASTLARTRAVIQYLNTEFEEGIRMRGHKFYIEMSTIDDATEKGEFQWPRENTSVFRVDLTGQPKPLSKSETVAWVGKVLQRTRGRELIGNFNPLLIGALFWEQSTKWEQHATKHVTKVSRICRDFLRKLLEDTCPKDVELRIWNHRIEPELKKRHQAALKELSYLIQDLKEYPINYNHYYTDTISKRRQQRQQAALRKALAEATTTRSMTAVPTFGMPSAANGTSEEVNTVDTSSVIAQFSLATNPDMNEFACEEALDCLFAIYKVALKTFVANVTTQVIERHIVRGLEKIFSPVVVNNLEAAHAEQLALEPAATRTRRGYLEEQIKKLEEGHEIFQSVM